MQALHELRSEILRLGPWHHDLEVVAGVRTGDVTRSHSYPPAFGDVTLIDAETYMSRFMQAMRPAGFQSRSVLDCACNAGGWLFVAARLGGGKCFGFDAREHWIEQARFIARHRASENIEFAHAEFASLPQMNLGKFDITLFMGIFYHLPGLKIAADHTRELLVVELAPLAVAAAASKVSVAETNRWRSLTLARSARAACSTAGLQVGRGSAPCIAASRRAST